MKQILRCKSPDELEREDIISWAGFHAQSIEEADILPKAIIRVRPPFEEKSATVLMCKHTMLKMRKLIEFCNPRETPVRDCDLP